MADTVKLTAEAKDTAKNPRQIRQAGFIPATVYAKGMDSASIQVSAKEFNLEYKKNPSATFEFKVAGKNFKVQVANVKTNHATAENMNVEFKLV